MATNHTFLGMWEIVESSVTDKSGNFDLKGVKFRLDQGDIIWYSDVVVPNFYSFAKRDCDEVRDNIYTELVFLLLGCETFEIVDLLSNGPGLVLSTYAGHNIEFKTSTFTPEDMMTLNCEGWCKLVCKRVKEDETVGQAGPFSLLCALQEGYFTDVIIKSSDGIYFEVHSVILRLNGFDCSMNFKSVTCDSQGGTVGSSDQGTTGMGVVCPTTNHFLLPPPPQSGGCLSKKCHTGSFNCLTSSGANSLSPPISQHAPNSSSDSDLRFGNHRKEVFNFMSPPPPLTPTADFAAFRCPPLSPRFRCDTPTSLDTPPTSPLTPISILYNLPNSLLTPITHWLYAESLPPNLNEDTCEKLIQFSEQMPPLNKMTQPCKKYLKYLRLKKFIIDLMMAIHAKLDYVIRKLSPGKVNYSPEALCSEFVEAFRDLTVGFGKILEFCNIFLRENICLNRFQRHEIIKFSRSRMPIFLAQIHQLMRNINDILVGLDASEKSQLASYLVPVIESSLDQVKQIVFDVKVSLKNIYENMKVQKGGKDQKDPETVDVKHYRTGSGNAAAYQRKYCETDSEKAFGGFLYEVRKIRDIYGRIRTAYEVIEQNRQTFMDMTAHSKETTIRRNLDYLLLELPSYIRRLASLENNFDSTVGWKEFKFCFKLATGQINGIISKLIEHKTAFQSIILRICDFVQRDEFMRILCRLGLIDDKIDNNNSGSFSAENLDYGVDYKNIKLNLVRHLCESPNILLSQLSKNALRLLHSGEMSDMEFEVISPATNYSKHSNRSGIFATPNVHIFRAHRAIVATRCEWFRKALLSGMKEDIDRKIVIHDTSPMIFRRFLLYLYGAPIDKTVGAEQICELMLLADRYSIDELKDICEQILRTQIDEECVIFLLSIADRFNATILKSSCLSFISNHVHIINMEIFRELAPNIQAEVHELIQWRNRTPLPWNTGTANRDSPKRSAPSSASGLNGLSVSHQQQQQQPSSQSSFNM